MKQATPLTNKQFNLKTMLFQGSVKHNNNERLIIFRHKLKRHYSK